MSRPQYTRPLTLERLISVVREAQAWRDFTERLMEAVDHGLRYYIGTGELPASAHNALMTALATMARPNDKAMDMEAEHYRTHHKSNQRHREYMIAKRSGGTRAQRSPTNAEDFMLDLGSEEDLSPELKADLAEARRLHPVEVQIAVHEHLQKRSDLFDEHGMLRKKPGESLATPFGPPPESRPKVKLAPPPDLSDQEDFDLAGPSDPSGETDGSEP